MLDDSDRIAVALQVLRKRHRLDFEALGAVFREVHPESVVARAMVRGVGIVCDAELCSAWATVGPERRDEARGLLIAEGMADLLDATAT